jgi:hypothetical protein
VADVWAHEVVLPTQLGRAYSILGSHQHGTEGGEEKKGRKKEREQGKGKEERARGRERWQESRVQRAALLGGVAGEDCGSARGEHGGGGFGGRRSKRGGKGRSGEQGERQRRAKRRAEW